MLLIIRKMILIGCVLIGLSLIGQGGYIKLKAQLADWLIAGSWASRSVGQAPTKPWPWADTHAVARLSIPRLDIEQFVMRDASGESLAFGPGAVLPGQLPGTNETTVIAGHRDTHFRFLSDLGQGDLIEVENTLGETWVYRVTSTRVVDSEREELFIDTDQQGLLLVTCWPFDALVPGGPERYLVEAVPYGRVEQKIAVQPLQVATGAQ